jgi:hypothetical protein
MHQWVTLERGGFGSFGSAFLEYGNFRERLKEVNRE